jgi:hypothetical protein
LTRRSRSNARSAAMSSQPDKPVLRLDWCSHEAAKYAVEHWHYSRSMPVGKCVRVGVWEQSVFIGCVLFAWGMNKDLLTPYGLKIAEGAELVRVALNKHVSSTSRIVAIALKLLRIQSPGLRLLVSFADPTEGHHGGIYQAGGWIYAGKSPPVDEWVLNGRRLNRRAFTGQQFGGGRASVAGIPPGAVKTRRQGKHRYLMPLDAEIKKRILPLSKPYPKRAGSDTKDTPANLAGKGGSTPTPALHPDSGGE